MPSTVKPMRATALKMSGPYCDSCGFFHPAPLSQGKEGECSDPTKLIYSKNGDAKNESPEVQSSDCCQNWKPQSKQPN